MEKKYILAIDQGTTSSRALLFDKNQEVVAVAQKEIKNLFPKPGWVEVDANEIWLSVLSVISEVITKSRIDVKEIASIGITNQRETTILWDKETGLPVYNGIVWQSRQTNEIVQRYKNQGVENRVKEKTGLVLDPYFSATKINWIFENVEGVKDNHNILFGTVDTFLLWKMTAGKVHATDVTNASRTLLFNIHELNWDKELLKIFNVPEYILPEIKDTSGYFGEIESSLFFNQTCPICAMVGDQQSALFGESCFSRGDVKNTYGTGGFLLMNTGDKEIISDRGMLTTVAWKINDEVKYALEGSIFSSGSVIQWLRDGLHIIKTASETKEIAESVDSSNGVVIIPAFTGLGAPYWNEECKAAIFGLTRGVDYRHIVRAALESMAFQSKDLIITLEKDLNSSVSALRVDGGASANEFLLQYQSDILEIPVIKSRINELTALGAARLAGLATSFYSMSDFKEDIEMTYLPKKDHEEVEREYGNYKKAVDACMKY